MKKFNFNELKMTDAKRLVTILNDNDIKHALPGLYCENLEDVQNLINYSTMSGNHLYEIVDNKNNIIGILTSEFRTRQSVELSLFITKAYRNKKFASASLKEFLEELKSKNPNITDVFFFIDKENYKSKKTVESIGANFSHTYDDNSLVYRKTISNSEHTEHFI